MERRHKKWGRGYFITAHLSFLINEERYRAGHKNLSTPGLCQLPARHLIKQSYFKPCSQYTAKITVEQFRNFSVRHYIEPTSTSIVHVTVYEYTEVFRHQQLRKPPIVHVTVYEYTEVFRHQQLRKPPIVHVTVQSI